MRKGDPGVRPSFEEVGLARKPEVGELAPLFVAATTARPEFAFGSLGGLWILMVFAGQAGAKGPEAALGLLTEKRRWIEDHGGVVFVVSIDPADRAGGENATSPRFFWDFDRKVSELYGVVNGDAYQTRIVLIDPSMRIAATEPLSRIEHLLDAYEGLIKTEQNFWGEQIAPIVVAPRVFSPSLCSALIDYYQNTGGVSSGVMRQVDGMTVGVSDPTFKRRRDVYLEDTDMLNVAHLSLRRNLFPLLEKTYAWQCTRLERNLIACYDSSELGFFRPHRDNSTPGTAHRKFAVTINLNADDYDGGELRFPEFGPRTYKPPTGGAVVFSCSLLHEATPVTRGQRYAFLPFLYDEAGAKVRQANAARLA